VAWRRLVPCIVACCLAPASLLAHEPLRVSLEPVPLYVQGELSHAFTLEGRPPSHLAAGDSLVYSNTYDSFYNPPAWYPPGAGISFADDLHLTLPGRLTQFWFFFYEPYQTVVRPTVSFYANDENDSHLGSLLAGPYALGPYRWGAYKVHVTVQDTVFVGQNLWFALSFESPTSGAVLANPPFIGSSHDVYYDFTLGRTERFVGAFANIYLQVRVEPQPVGVEAVTWSHVKALYHSPAAARSGAP